MEHSNNHKPITGFSTVQALYCTKNSNLSQTAPLHSTYKRAALNVNNQFVNTVWSTVHIQYFYSNYHFLPGWQKGERGSQGDLKIFFFFQIEILNILTKRIVAPKKCSTCLVKLDVSSEYSINI